MFLLLLCDWLTSYLFKLRAVTESGKYGNVGSKATLDLYWSIREALTCPEAHVSCPELSQYMKASFEIGSMFVQKHKQVSV